ncbi:unnamed protein product [Trichobilharzia szidati]|nr:unnamed protein product [Trichobilharzia szidati]CAH8873227.1 unnamed protein product [Trichobilharzia szidati]
MNKKTKRIQNSITEYIPNAQNLSLQLLPNSNNRIIRLNWTVDKNKEILCPYKVFAFFEDNGKRCEFPTEMNYFEFDTLDLNKMYKIGVVVKSVQNSSLRNEVYMDYSTYTDRRIKCPTHSVSLVHKSVNPTLYKPKQYILRSLTEADMKNKTFQLFVRNRSVVMHEV